MGGFRFRLLFRPVKGLAEVRSWKWMTRMLYTYSLHYDTRHMTQDCVTISNEEDGIICEDDMFSSLRMNKADYVSIATV